MMDEESGTSLGAESSFKSWPLQRYARRATSEMKDNDVPTRRMTRSKHQPTTMTTSDECGQWTVYSTTVIKKLSIILTGDHQQLVVLKGKDLVMESIFLLNAQPSCKAITRGDSIMFLYMATGILSGTRQFRVKFEASNSKSGVEQCENFVERTRRIVRYSGEQIFQLESHEQETMEESATLGDPGLDNQVASHNQLPTEDQRDELTFSMSIGQAILNRTPLPQASMSACLSEMDDKLEKLIGSCLTDPTFPAFVDKVEKYLRRMTTTDKSANNDSSSLTRSPS